MRRSIVLPGKCIMEAIKFLKAGTSPGQDGLTAEFYKEYSEEMAPRLAKIFRQEKIQIATQPRVVASQQRNTQ